MLHGHIILNLLVLTAAATCQGPLGVFASSIRQKCNNWTQA